VRHREPARALRPRQRLEATRRIVVAREAAERVVVELEAVLARCRQRRQEAERRGGQRVGLAGGILDRVEPTLGVEREPESLCAQARRRADPAKK
jgi:hypothetical protein